MCKYVYALHRLTAASFETLAPCPVFVATPSLFRCLCLAINLHVFNSLFFTSFTLAAAVPTSQFALPDILPQAASE